MGDSAGSGDGGERSDGEDEFGDRPHPARPRQDYVTLPGEDLNRGASPSASQIFEVAVSAATGVAVRAAIDEAVRRLRRPKEAGKVAVIVGTRGETLATVRVDSSGVQISENEFARDSRLLRGSWNRWRSYRTRRWLRTAGAMDRPERAASAQPARLEASLTNVSRTDESIACTVEITNPSETDVETLAVWASRDESGLPADGHGAVVSALPARHVCDLTLANIPRSAWEGGGLRLWAAWDDDAGAQREPLLDFDRLS